MRISSTKQNNTATIFAHKALTPMNWLFGLEMGVMLLM